MGAFDSPVLHTPRLRLRPLREGDEAALLAIFGDARVMRYWSTPPWQGLEQARALVANDAAAMAAGEALRLGLEPADGGAIVGTCTLFAFAASSRRAEMGYNLAFDAWGAGLMTEALEALLAHGFGALGLNRVEADIDPRNEASARLLGRLGFAREGLLRERWIVAGEKSDSALYGLLRADWQARRRG